MELTIDIVGWIGAVLLVAAYGMLTARRLSAGGWVYQSMNLVGGLGLMANTAYYAAWPSAALNLVWFGIGLVGLLQSRRRRVETAARARRTDATGPSPTTSTTSVSPSTPPD